MMANEAFDQRPRHPTERGDFVRNKSEVLIANKLYNSRVDYAYEQALLLPQGSVLYPDFTITDASRGRTYYWEHDLALEDENYRVLCQHRRAQYVNAGIKPRNEGGGPNGILIETEEKPGGGIDVATIERVINDLIA